MNFFTLEESLGPRFIIFHYLIKWYLNHFGLLSYLLGIVGSVTAFFVYTISINIKKGERDTAFMIVLLSLIVVGGLIGIGLDMANTPAAVY